MTLEELKDALATYGVNPEERGLEVYVTTGDDEDRSPILRRVTAIDIDSYPPETARVTLNLEEE